VLPKVLVSWTAKKIVRLLVKEILVGEDTITIRHSIPIPSAPPQNGAPKLNGQNYLLCKGVISPLLANIYLHYAFDLWVNVWRKKWAHGEVAVVRYTDDIILGFQHQTDADRFLENLRERVGMFGLELQPR